METYEMILLSDSFSGGRKAVNVYFEHSNILIDPQGLNIKWNFRDVELKSGNGALDQIFIQIKDSKDYVLYTRDKSILKNENLKSIAGFDVYAKHLKRSFSTRKRTFYVLIVLPFVFFLLFLLNKDRMVRSIATRSSFELEQKMGQQVLDLYMDDAKLLDDSILNNQLQQITKPLINVIEADESFHIYLVQNDQTNAFALPGGHIIVHSALIQNAQAWDEIQGVLAHEIAHVTEKHHIRGLINKLGIFSVLSLFFGDVSAIFNVVLDLGMHLESLSYSRKYETEADEKAWEYLNKANINPEGLLLFFGRLDAEHDHSTGMMKYLSTHPLTKDRIKRLRQKIDGNVQVGYVTSEIDLETYKSRLDSIVKN